MGLGNGINRHFPSRSSTKLPLKPFCVLVPSVLDWGFITTSDQDVSALGDKECNSAYAGGEDSAGFLNDCRVLWLRKANS